MADTVSTQCSQDDGEPGSALATAAPVVQATPGGSQALETQTSSKPPPKMSLEVPVVCITPPSPIPGDSQDKPAESSPEKPNRVDGDPLQYLSCEVPNVSTKHPAAAAKESSLGVVPDINLDPLKHKQESTVLGGSEESRKEHEEQINVQIKSPLDNCPANHPLTDAERSVEKSDTRVEISTEKAASFESVSDSVTTCNESSTEKLTSESETSLKTSDEVGNATLENIPDSASLTEKNNTDHGAELSEDNTKNISPSSKDQTTPLTSSSSSVAEENVKEVVSSSSQEQVQAPVSENRASKVPLVLTDRSSSLPTVFSDQQSSKVPSAANQSSGSPLSCPSALADTLQSASSKEESNSSAVSDCSVSKNAHSSRTVQNSSSECGVEVEQSEVSSERSKEKTTDSISVTENLKEPLESEDVAKASKLTIKKVDEINDDHEVNTVDTTKVLSEQNVAHEVPVETIPVIVNTEEREQVKIGREVQGNFVSPVIPSSHSSAIASPDNVSSVDAEQLQPVTIGSSLQPLEEVQEASVSGDPSFAAADLALIDSSADEADSIGGLVINSVIGAADGVADFHPDEMETDRELTDISASAPHTVGENCDNVDSSDEIEPSAKRMRFENGGDDIEDKLQTSRNVNIKVSPIKNGHGLWDACKLRQILLEKGTIMLRLHASVDHMEMNDSDKENKDVDFTGIMIEIKDDDQDHILGLASLEPDADLCDPLAIGLTHNLDHTSPPHYSRGYPHHPRGRSTTLQPAMTRPVFKHLQSPPHSQHYMKQDLLGHPQPLEFEEPQLGTTEWAGVVRPSLGDEDDELEPFDISVIENVPLQLNPVQNKSVNSSPGVKFFKVCEYCGRAFNKKAAYIQHRNSHRPVQQCKKCNFKTKDVKRFKEHVDSHEENKPDIQCNLCPLQFTNILSRRNHKKNVHNVYECNHCSVDYISESKLKEHINDSHLPRKGVYVAIENVENGESSSIVSQESFSSSSPKKYLVCRLCNKETRNKYQLKIHLAQHLGVSSSTITDDNLLLEDVEQFAWDEENEIHIHSENNAVYRNAESEGAGNVSILSSEVHKEVRLRDGELDSIQLQGNLIVKEEPIEIDIVEKHHDAELTRYQAPIIFPRRVGRPMVMLTCDQCGDTFKSPKALRNHQKLRHRRLVKCPACNITRVNTKKMLAHQKTAHKNKFRCHFHCLALFDTRNELSSHHLNIHKKDDSKLVCRYCRQNYPRGTYMNHLKHCEEDPLMRRAPCICSHCEASFSSPDELNRHMKFCSSKIPEPESSKTVEKKDFDLNTEVVEDNVSKSKEEKTVSSKSKPVEKEDVNLDTDMAEDNILISKKEETVSRKSLQSSILKEKVVIDCTSQVQDNMITEKVKEAAQDKVGPQRCKYCSKTFDTVDDGINHVLCSHRVLISNITKEPRMCHLCGKNFLSGLALCKHILKHYSDTGLWDSLVPPDLNMETVRSICWICKTKGMVNHRYHATRRDNFIEKLLTTRYIEPDSNDIYHCSACDEGFQSRFAFWKHIKLHMSKAFFKNAEGGKRFKCTRCPLKFLKKSQLYGHIATHLLDPYIITQGEEDCVDDGGDERCESDEASNKTLGGAKNSIAQNKLMVKHAILAGKLSSSQVPQKCKRCRKKFKSLEDAVEHVFTTHKTILGNMMDDTQACHVCDKTFMKPMILCKHLLIHYRELNMLDDLVPRDLLKRTKDRRYCWICNNMLGRKASRHINMRNNVIEKILSNENEELNEEDNFPCSLCGDVCTTRYNFWKHIVLHMYKFPKKFKKVSDSSSPNSSEASKELRCSDCSLRFNEKSALNKHLATHFLLPYTGQEIEEEKTTPDKKDAIPCIEEIIPDKTDDPVYTESKPSEKNQASNNTIRLRNKVPKLGDRSYSSQQCTCCSEIFQNTDEAVRHVISLHKSEINQTICQPFKCHMCGTVFKSTWCLCKHISKHYSNLGMWDALVPHDLLDSYDLRNQCWICKGQLEKNYTDHINKRNVVIEKLLLTKMNQAEDSEDFKCSLCDRFYKGRLTFWRHIQLHLSKAPIKVRGKRVVKPPLNIIDYENHQFSCNECSLYFLDEQELYEHLATHFICKYEEMQAIQNVSEDSQSNLSFGEELEPLVHIELQTKRKLGEGEGHKLDVLSDQVDDSNQRKKRKILKTGRNKDDEEVNTEWEIEEDTDIEESESECDIESMDEIETDDEVGEETDE